VVVVGLAGFGAGASGQEGIEEARQKTAQALEGLIAGVGDDSLAKFADRYLSNEYRRSMSEKELLAHLRRIRTSCASAGGIMAEPVGKNGVRFVFDSMQVSHTVEFRLQENPPYKITELTWKKGRPGGEASRKHVELKPITWDTLEQRLTEEERNGFSGTVLVVHDGKVVLHRGYGQADRERGLPNTKDTIFAIGSTPIDFTKAAILKLEEMGRLSTSDPITKYLPNVPDDKKAITIEHLMTGRSGLPNFHHIPGKDKDYDLTWIDRATAIQRILGKELLFEPGKGKAHSHSAWGLLAAIVEIVSNQTYEEFLQQYFFTPAGMEHTGAYEETSGFSADSLAVGYGMQSVGKVNTPRYWGKTSWLVKGSGGMVSNPGDLYKWIRAIRSGKTLSAKAAAKYWSGGALAGSNDRGFFCLYTEGPDNLMILCSNAHTAKDDRAEPLGKALARLVMSGR